MKTHWKTLNNPDYLGAYSLLGVTDELKVKITNVKEEYVKGPDGKSEKLIIAYLENQKPMILNATNCKVITSIYDTPFIEEWKGKEIILHVERVKAFGDVVDSLRVKKQKPKLPELKPTDKEWDGVKTALKNGYTIAQIKQKYTISAKNEKTLTDGNKTV